MRRAMVFLQARHSIASKVDLRAAQPSPPRRAAYTHGILTRRAWFSCLRWAAPRRWSYCLVNPCVFSAKPDFWSASWEREQSPKRTRHCPWTSELLPLCYYSNGSKSDVQERVSLSSIFFGCFQRSRTWSRHLEKESNAGSGHVIVRGLLSCSHGVKQ